MSLIARLGLLAKHICRHGNCRLTTLLFLTVEMSIGFVPDGSVISSSNGVSGRSSSSDGGRDGRRHGD
jgi:hypothetical protein